MSNSYQNEVPPARVNIQLDLHTGGAKKKIESMNDFSPEQIAKKIPHLRSLLAMRNLLRDLKSNLLDNATFRYELEKIVKDEQLSDELRTELESIVSQSTK